MDELEYKSLREQAATDGIVVATRQFTDRNVKTSGVSVAYKKINNGRMVHVSVSYCNSKDQFSRKTGIYNALNKLYDGESIQIPFNLKDECDGKYGVLSDRLLNMFTYR